MSENGIDIAELATVGAKIAEIGLKLYDLRNQRSTLSQQIAELEKEVTPLVVQHSKILASILGTPLAPPPLLLEDAQPPLGIVGVSRAQHLPPPSNGDPGLKARIKAYLKTVDKSVSSQEVAEHLHVDGALVREAMREGAVITGTGPEV